MREGRGKMFQQRGQLAGVAALHQDRDWYVQGAAGRPRSRAGERGRSGSPIGRQDLNPESPPGPACSPARVAAPGAHLQMEKQQVLRGSERPQVAEPIWTKCSGPSRHQQWEDQHGFL